MRGILHDVVFHLKKNITKRVRIIVATYKLSHVKALFDIFQNSKHSLLHEKQNTNAPQQHFFVEDTGCNSKKKNNVPNSKYSNIYSNTYSRKQMKH